MKPWTTVGIGWSSSWEAVTEGSPPHYLALYHPSSRSPSSLLSAEKEGVHCEGELAQTLAILLWIAMDITLWEGVVQRVQTRAVSRPDQTPR